MNRLVFVEGMAGLMMLVAAGTALLARPTIRSGILLSLHFRVPERLRWHRLAGWIALSGLVLISTAFPLANLLPTSAIYPRNLTHGILCTVCALTVLNRAWVMQRRVKRGMKQVVAWIIAVMTFGTCFFALACALMAWRWGNATAVWNWSQSISYQAVLLGHVALGITLIWLGRTALRVSAHSKGGLHGFR